MTPGARDRLRGLERTLRQRLHGHVHDLHTSWSRHGRDGAVNKAYLKRFCDAFLSHQKALIDAELDSLQQVDERQQREQAHQDFGAERARVFAGRQALLARIARYTETAPEARAIRPARKKPQAAPLMLLGGGGSGKSALLARAAQEAARQSKGSGAIVLQRYIGGVPGTESLTTTLKALTADIASLYGQPEPPTPESAKSLAEGFRAALGHATASRPLILYLDALDQLDKADSDWMLEWLPKALPEHVRVVASLRTGTSVEQPARRRYPNLIEVPAMKPTEGRAMLKAWLADKRAAWFNAGIAPSRGRRLTRQQEQAVLAAFNHAGSALWLKLAYEEAATWASWDAPRELPITVQGLIEDWIEHRLIQQENHPRVFTERALAYMTAGRFGLAENELGRALGTDGAVRAEFQANEKTQRKWEDEKLLPPIIWSRLYFDLQAYLGLAQIDGALVMRWFHREFAEVLKSKHLASDQDRQEVHGALADTFLQLERELRPEETNDDALFKATDASGKQVSAALRRVMEQPWQLAQAGRREDLQALLTGFGFCMGKCAANAGADLIEDYRASGSWEGTESPKRAWLSLVREKGHLLRRDDVRWPAHKILLQVAVEHADASAVTFAAEEWLKRNLCDWVWVRQVNRPKSFQPSPLVAVMEGHTHLVWGASLVDGRVLSWSMDDTLRLWDGQTGALLVVIKGHTDWVSGAQVLPDGRLLSWSNDHTLRLWDGRSGVPLAVLEGHTGGVNGARLLPDGRLLSWSHDHTLRLWDGQTSAALAVLEGHTWVKGAQVLPDGRVLSWSDESTLRLWDGQSGLPLAVLEGHTEMVKGAQVLPDGRVLSWSEDSTLRLWDGQSGLPLAVLEGHTNGVNGAQLLPDGRLLSWSEGNTLRLWDGQSGLPLAELEGHTERVKGAQVLPDARVLSWSDDHTLRVWDGVSGALLATLVGHFGRVRGAISLSDNSILSWSEDATLRLWHGQSGALINTMVGHTDSVDGAFALPDGGVLSWSVDRTLRRWDQTVVSVPPDGGHLNCWLDGVQSLRNGRVVSWSRDRALRLWDSHSDTPLAVLEGHTGGVNGAQLLPDGRMLSWSDDETLRLWNGNSGAPLEIMEGHTNVVNGAQLLPDGRILSWSDDGTLRLWDGQSGAQLGVFEGHGWAVQGASLLPDGRILSWAFEGLSPSPLRLWCSNSVGLLAQIPRPWVWSAKLPNDWSSSLRELAGAQRSGKLWGQSVGASVAFADELGHWRAMWHGDAGSLKNFTGTRAVYTSGRQIIFLQIMRGVQPMDDGIVVP